MQQHATMESSSTFAGMMAAFTTPGQKRPPGRDLDGLEDDVATLSYERALRAHSRFRSLDATDRALTQVPPPERLRIVEVFPADLEPAGQAAPVPAGVPSVARAKPELVPDNSTAYDRNLKCASITIRLSRAECAQLRQRAAEAGLNLSAYLRSCTVEAESLRAQVVNTLAQMRAEKPSDNQVAASVPGRRWFDWPRRFWPRAHTGPSITEA
jgi:hypothetical protein